jgi:hypothetical protein
MTTKDRSAKAAQTNEETLIDYSCFVVALWLVANQMPLPSAIGQTFAFVGFAAIFKGFKPERFGNGSANGLPSGQFFSILGCKSWHTSSQKRKWEFQPSLH